jgi:heptosyltransferase-1
VRALFVKLGAIGDIVHTLPALAAVKRARPDVRIAWAAERRSAEILRDNPLIDDLIELDSRAMREGGLIDEIMPELRRQIGPLRKMEFDVAIDFQGLLKSGAVTKISGAPVRWGFSRKQLREPASRIFLNRTVKLAEGLHVIERNLALAEAALGPLGDTRPLEFPIFPNAEHRVEAQRIASECGGPFAILNPAGGWVTKLWNAGNFGKLADRLWDSHGLASVVAVGPKEAELAERVAAESSVGRTRIVAPALKGFYELAKLASVYVGGDTGPTHLAIAAGAPVVGLFGPTEWWRNGSPYADDICIERNDIGCRVDCHRRTCSNWICMDISVERVAEAVAERLRTSVERPAGLPVTR